MPPGAAPFQELKAQLVKRHPSMNHMNVRCARQGGLSSSHVASRYHTQAKRLALDLEHETELDALLSMEDSARGGLKRGSSISSVDADAIAQLRRGSSKRNSTPRTRSSASLEPLPSWILCDSDDSDDSDTSGSDGDFAMRVHDPADAMDALQPVFNQGTSTGIPQHALPISLTMELAVPIANAGSPAGVKSARMTYLLHCREKQLLPETFILRKAESPYVTLCL